MEFTDRLSLPLLIAGQAQKEVFHNESLCILDAVVAAAVETSPINDPPPDPIAGACYLIGESPSGDWAQFPGYLATFSSAGWRFVAPAPGLAVFVKDNGTYATYTVGGWEFGTVSGSRLVIDGIQVVGPQAAAVPDPLGGATVDAEARTSLVEVLEALRSHGLIAT